MVTLFKKLTGDNKIIKRAQKLVDQINDLEQEFSILDDNGVHSKANDLKLSVANGQKLDDILVPAFALVREAAKRTLGQRHYDVQLIGGIALHSGQIAEMKTGEGKTLVATLPAFLNALEMAVHVVTVND